MTARPSRSHRLLLLFISLLALLLAACGGSDEDTPTPLPPSGGTPAAVQPQATAPSTNAAPYVLRVVRALSPSLEPACLEPATELSLRAAPLPAGGLQPGVSHLFCAVGASPGSEVTFTLVGPDGEERTFTRSSEDQGEAAVAAFDLRLTEDDEPGAYSLQASTAGEQSEMLRFDVQAPTGPYITLLDDPLPDNPGIIRAVVGGLPPAGVARFALYSLSEPMGDSDEALVFDGSVLISTNLIADAEGRADLELDVGDLPTGPYLMALLPQGIDLGDPPTLRLPEQDRLIAMANINRTQVAAGPETGTPAAPEATAAPSDQPLVPPAGVLPLPPVPVSSGGGFPDTLSTAVVVASLPVCQPAGTPALQLWPGSGEIGDWWLGCARGFAPNETVQITVNLPNGETTVIAPTTGADGTAPFRWYATPGEGVGEYTAAAVGSAGARASLTWRIDDISRPHALVFPHEYLSGQPGEFSLSGFPANSTVQVGLYRLGEGGSATLVKRWRHDVNRWGAYTGSFDQIVGEEPGQYLIVTQGGQAYQIAGIDVAASAVEFFSFNAPLDPRYEVFTLYLGRGEGSLITVEATPAPTATPTTAPVVEATSEPPAAEVTPEPAGEFPPAVIALPEDNSPPPTCPGVAAGEAAICMLPTTLPRGSFVYMYAHDFPPNTPFNVTVTQPNGIPVPLATAPTDASGFVDFHWYTLNTEPLGEYQVVMRGGGSTFNGSFTVVDTPQPLVVVQPRTTPPGAPVIISVNGFEVREPLIITRYRRTGSENGTLTFERMDSTRIRTGGIGGAQRQFSVAGARTGDLFLVTVHRPDGNEFLAQAVYDIADPLYLRYPFAWGQNFQEGQ